jgi:heme-degrading monooxygenase HmoA
MFASTPEPPYWVVIFTSHRQSDEGYGAMSERMESLAAQQPGYLGIESVRGADGVGITISYWTDRDSIAAWKANLEHRQAQSRGREQWYSRYHVRVAKVEHDYEFPA